MDKSSSSKSGWDEGEWMEATEDSTVIENRTLASVRKLADVLHKLYEASTFISNELGFAAEHAAEEAYELAQGAAPPAAPPAPAAPRRVALPPPAPRKRAQPIANAEEANKEMPAPAAAASAPEESAGPSEGAGAQRSYQRPPRIVAPVEEYFETAKRARVDTIRTGPKWLPFGGHPSHTGV